MEYEESPQSAPQLCLLTSISWVCISAASWRWGLCPSTGEGRLVWNTCTSRPVFPAASSLRWCCHRSRKPAWSGPRCKYSCRRPRKRSWCPLRVGGPTCSLELLRCFYLQHFYRGLWTDLRSHQIFLPDSSQPMTWLKAQLLSFFFSFFTLLNNFFHIFGLPQTT